MNQVNIQKLVEDLTLLKKPKNPTFEILENKVVKRILVKKFKEGVSLNNIQKVLKNNGLNVPLLSLKNFKNDILKKNTNNNTSK